MDIYQAVGHDNRSVTESFALDGAQISKIHVSDILA